MIDLPKIWTCTQLPTLPTVALKLLRISKDPETGIDQIVDVIRTDPAIAAKILKLANSSFFGLSSKVISIDRAVPMLGKTVVTSLAFGFSLDDASMARGELATHYNNYWKRSVIQGIAADVLGEYASNELECEYFLAGLLVDLGRLAMLKTIPQEYVPVLLVASC